MRQFIIIAVSLIMFFAVGVQLDFGDEVELPEWVEELISEDDGGMVNMTTSPIYTIAKNSIPSIQEEAEPPSAK